MAPGELPYAPDLVVADVSFISLTKVLPAVLACCAERFDALAMVKPQFEVGRERVGKGGVVRDAADRRRSRWSRWRGGARRSGAAVLGFASSGLPGPKGNRETFVWLAEAGRAAARWPTSRRAAARGRAGDASCARDGHRAHPRPPGADRRRRCARCSEAAERAGVRPALRRRGDAQARPDAGARGSCSTRRSSDDVDLCVVLGGDGTILRALRRYAGTSVPVFAVNFGEVGFLATIDPDEVGDGLRLRAGVAPATSRC